MSCSEKQSLEVLEEPSKVLICYVLNISLLTPGSIPKSVTLFMKCSVPAAMSLMGQNIADMLRRNNVNVVENGDVKVNLLRDPEENANNIEAVNGHADDQDEEEEEEVNDAQEVGHDEGRLLLVSKQNAERSHGNQ